MDACFSLVGSSSETHQKFPIHFVQMVGDEWPERLFTLPKWIMKNMDNLIQHSKHILNSEYGKCIVLHTVTLSRDTSVVAICCLLPSIHFPSIWNQVPFTHSSSHMVQVGLAPYPSLEVGLAWLKIAGTSHLQDHSFGFRVGITHGFKQTCFLGLLVK